jgi:hypothetical protein
VKNTRTILIKIDRPDPGPEQIQHYKNFPRFVDQFFHLHTPAGFRWRLKSNLKKLVFFLIIALLLLLWYLGEL